MANHASCAQYFMDMFPGTNSFFFEWEATPVLYSWGMTKLDPPLHFLFVTQPERFTGSVEFNISTQLYTNKIGASHWGFSGQLLAHLPLVECGEYLGLNLGVARYNIAGYLQIILLEDSRHSLAFFIIILSTALPMKFGCIQLNFVSSNC